MHNAPEELLIGAPATFGSVFTAYGRWELPLNRNAADVDTFYVRTIKKQIIADACGSLTTPYGTYTSVLREHEYITEIDSVYGKMSTIQVYSTEYKRDSTNTYSYIANGIGYPVCIVHCDKHNAVKDVEYFSGYYTGIDELHKQGSQLLLYPNPSDGNITIEMYGGNNSDLNQIFIYNEIGSLILQKNTAEPIIKIDNGTLSKGIYFVRVKNKENARTTKFVIQ